MEERAPLERCVDCKRRAPEAQGTLLSTLGWRLRRVTDANGNSVAYWRCPECATKRRNTSPIGTSDRDSQNPERVTTGGYSVISRPGSTVPSSSRSSTGSHPVGGSDLPGDSKAPGSKK